MTPFLSSPEFHGSVAMLLGGIVIGALLARWSSRRKKRAFRTGFLSQAKERMESRVQQFEDMSTNIQRFKK